MIDCRIFGRTEGKTGGLGVECTDEGEVAEHLRLKMKMRLSIECCTMRWVTYLQWSYDRSTNQNHWTLPVKVREV